MIRSGKHLPVWLLAVLVGVPASGCGSSGPPGPAPAQPGATADREKYLLASEPAGGKPVKEVRKEARDGDEVVIVGHIGGDAKPWVEGRAAFWIVDPSIPPCPKEENCPTPWDCCCHTNELPGMMATIKIVDAAGQTVAVDARQLLGLKESQTVVVQGKARRDDKGNLTVLAQGLFVRP